MNKRNNLLRWSLGVCVAMWMGGSAGRAATFNISVGDNFFNPSSQTINVGDTVVWIWIGFGTHDVTSSSLPTVLASGNKMNGGTFSFTFSSAGTFPYVCTRHPGQSGTITVQAANILPAVSITSPTNNTTILAGTNAVIQGSATDNGSVVRVDVFASGILIGSVTNAPFAPFSFTSTNAPAGNYLLTAVATDNLGANSTSAGVNIQILTNATLVPNFSVTNLAAFTLSNSFAGQTYRIDALTNFAATNFTATGFAWFPLATNVAASNDFLFTDLVLTNRIPRLYRVRQTF